MYIGVGIWIQVMYIGIDIWIQVMYIGVDIWVQVMLLGSTFLDSGNEHCPVMVGDRKKYSIAKIHQKIKQKNEWKSVEGKE